MDSIAAFDVQSVLARTLWAEARSQGTEGMAAVACAIQNRARNPGWWGKDVRSVCLAHEQFSCWNSNDPQFARIRAPQINDAAFPIADAIAEIVMLQGLADFTHGADHYRAEYVSPAWTVGKTPTLVVGDSPSRHYFYKLGLSG
jgi:spore germination cell wall hydrolase CwlJ-like protein